MARVPDTAENEDRCICHGCPTYPREGLIFCSHGRSERFVEKIGCLCPDCDNFGEYDLQDGYYCADGRPGEDTA
jgi:hypothetical protein